MALVALCALAVVLGGGLRERTGALIVASSAAAALLTPVARDSWVWALFAADLLVVVLLGRLAWKAPRIWPIWVMAAAAVGAAASLAFAVQPDVDEETYRRALLLTRYAAALALLVGARGARASHL